MKQYKKVLFKKMVIKMGRVKEQLLEDEEQEVIQQHSAISSVMYNDMFDMDELENPNLRYVCIVQSIGNTYKTHIIPPVDIVYISGLCIRYNKLENSINKGKRAMMVSIPLDKILYMYLEYKVE